MPRLRVRVMGYVGTGKTTLIELLTERLRALGLQFIVRGEEEDHTSGTTSERVEALRERETLVEIESVHLRTPIHGRSEEMKTCLRCNRDIPLKDLATTDDHKGGVGFVCVNEMTCNFVALQFSRGRPFRSFVLGGDEWWHPVDEDGKVYESMRYDAEAVLSGYLPGVKIHIFSPEGS